MTGSFSFGALGTSLRLCLATFSIVFLSAGAFSQPSSPPPRTWCNPLNLDYAYVLRTDRGVEQHRSTADPAVVTVAGKFYLFSTNQQGYWWSDNFARWQFVPQSFKRNISGDDVCAPGVLAMHDTLIFLPCFTDRDTMPLYRMVGPAPAPWTEATPSFPIIAWDPGFFRDDDGKMFVYWGSSNTFPIRGRQIDPLNGYKPVGNEVPLVLLHPERNGWEGFGEENMDTTIQPYTEGAWMTKFNGKYYLQYAAPGTEFNVYADGVYVGDGPLGPFRIQDHNPFSSKRGGFITGAGHGSTFPDRWGNWWHIGTVVAWIKHKFERRIAVFPAGFDRDGVLFANTSFGDYPQLLATGKRDQAKGGWTGWAALAYKKAATASSSLPAHPAGHAVDENIRTYWSAATADSGEWLQVDMGKVSRVQAIQVNYADEGATLVGKVSGIYHSYRIYGSEDGRNWNLVVDRSRNRTDVPHDYVELMRSARMRYVKLVNIHVPTGKFAVSGLRVFGKANEPAPAPVKDFRVERSAADPRKAELSWTASPGAYAYNLSYGVSPGKRYTDILLHDSTHYTFRGMTVGQEYYFSIQPVGEGGAGRVSEVVQASKKIR
jgi:xylan 1,4-beta-xylosidase